MISIDIAAAQVNRWRGLDFFPARDEEALFEVVHALGRAARHESHAERIVDWWLRHHAVAPKPSEIYETAQRLAPEFNSKPSSYCVECEGTGFRRVYLLQTWRTGEKTTIERISPQVYAELRARVGKLGHQQVAPGVERCPACDYGRRLATAELVEQQVND